MAIKILLAKKGLKVVKSLIGEEVFRKVAWPYVKEAVDRHQESRKDRVFVPDVLDLKLTDARNYLEKEGFVVHSILARPQNKYQDLAADTVVSTSPRSGKVKAGSLIKLYYVNEEIINESRTMVTLPQVINKPLSKASAMLLASGFEVEQELLPAHKKYGDKKSEHVIEMRPAPSVVLKQVKKGSTIVLKYLDDEILEESKQLMESAKERMTKRNERVRSTVGNLKKTISHSGRKGKTDLKADE